MIANPAPGLVTRSTGRPVFSQGAHSAFPSRQTCNVRFLERIQQQSRIERLNHMQGAWATEGIPFGSVFVGSKCTVATVWYAVSPALVLLLRCKNVCLCNTVIKVLICKIPFRGQAAVADTAYYAGSPTLQQVE